MMNDFMEECMEPIKTLSFTRNELLYIDDSVTMLIEPEAGLPLPFRPLMTQALVSIPANLMEKIGRGLLRIQNQTEVPIELEESELYMLRELAISYMKINGEPVGYNLKKKIYQALLGDEAKEEEDRQVVENMLLKANVDMSSSIE